MKKILIYAAIALASVSCYILDEGDDLELNNTKWCITGCASPYQYKEISGMIYTYTNEDGTDGADFGEIFFTDGKMTIVFPDGRYRTVGYTQDRDNKTLTFDGVAFYGNGVPNIVTCHYTMTTILGKPFLTMYEAEDKDDIKIDEGEWALHMSKTTKLQVTLIEELTGEYTEQ